MISPTTTSYNEELKIVELSDFLVMEFPNPELLLSPWLPKAGLCMIHAFRGIGKTHLALGIAHAVATGGHFLEWNAPKPRGVLYIDGEMRASVLQERLKKITQIYPRNSNSQPLRILTPDLQNIGIPDLSTIEGQCLIDKYITDDIELVIIDNISCLAPRIKENDANDWAIIQSWILRLRVKGKSVLLIHHSGKSGSQRGSSKKEDVLDTVIVLQQPHDYEASQGARFIIKYEKSRGFFGEDAKSFEASLSSKDDKVEWNVHPDKDNTYQKVISLINEGLTQSQIVSQLKINKSTVSRHIKLGRQKGLITSHADER
jgi:RecA-family ATPase